MKHPDDMRALITRLGGALDTETVTVLDLDEFRARLEDLAAALDDNDTVAESLARLRRDYEERIAGMLKAIAAADRSRTAFAEALTEIKNLPSLSTAQLIERYRTVSARLRHHFPTSFGPLRASGQRGK